MSSFKLGPGLRAKICKNYNCDDDNSWNSMELYGPYSVGVLWDGTNDYARHVIIQPYDVKSNPLVTLFSVPWFGLGRSGLFGVGTYTNFQIEGNHLFDHGVSSLIVPDGLRIQIYKGDFFTGEMKEIVGPRNVDLYID